MAVTGLTMASAYGNICLTDTDDMILLVDSITDRYMRRRS